MERKEEVPYARPAGRQANATQEAFARARSVWPRLDSTTGPSRALTNGPDLTRAGPKPTCAGPPGRARACRVLCGLTLASSLLPILPYPSSISLPLSIPFFLSFRSLRTLVSVSFPPALLFFHPIVSFFFLLLFLSSFVSLCRSFSSFFPQILEGFSRFFSPFVRSSFLLDLLPVSTKGKFLLNFALLRSPRVRRSRHGYVPVSPFSWQFPPPCVAAAARSALSLGSGPGPRRWAGAPERRRRRTAKGGGADSGVSNEGSCRLGDIAGDRSAKWNSN